MFMTEVKITVTLILRSKTRIYRKINFCAPFSFDRHNTIERLRMRKYPAGTPGFGDLPPSSVKSPTIFSEICRVSEI